jgi:RNA polymerase sigma-70 factor (ECF subfamily)
MIETDRERILKELMISSLEGDQAAYQKLLSEISLIAKSYLIKRCRQLGPDRIDDLVQEVLMTVHLKKSSYRTDLPFLPWIYTVTKHKLIDDFRSSIRKTRLDEKLSSDKNEIIKEETKEDDFELELLVSGINEKQREILLMAKVEEIPLAEIATQLKMSLSAVKVTIHRAIKNIRK